jgi:hypothetical protein
MNLGGAEAHRSTRHYFDVYLRLNAALATLPASAYDLVLMDCPPASDRHRVDSGRAASTQVKLRPCPTGGTVRGHPARGQRTADRHPTQPTCAGAPSVAAVLSRPARMSTKITTAAAPMSTAPHRNAVV